MVKTLSFQCRGHGFSPLLGKTLHMPRDAAKQTKQQKVLLTVLEAGSPRSGYQLSSSEGPVPGCRCLTVPLQDGGAWGTLQGPFYIVSNPFHEGTTLMVQSPTDGPTSSCRHLGHWDVHIGIQGHKLSDHSITQVPVQSRDRRGRRREERQGGKKTAEGSLEHPPWSFATPPKQGWDLKLKN